MNDKFKVLKNKLLTEAKKVGTTMYIRKIRSKKCDLQNQKFVLVDGSLHKFCKRYEGELRSIFDQCTAVVE